MCGFSCLKWHTTQFLTEDTSVTWDSWQWNGPLAAKSLLPSISWVWNNIPESVSIVISSKKVKKKKTNKKKHFIKLRKRVCIHSEFTKKERCAWVYMPIHFLPKSNSDMNTFLTTNKISKRTRVYVQKIYLINSSLPSKWLEQHG